MTAQMTSTAMPTAEQHGFRPHSDGAFVPVQTRSERFRSVDVGDFEPVTGREHEWKLSPVAAFADLTGGPLDGSRVEIETADVAGVDVTWIARDDARGIRRLDLDARAVERPAGEVGERGDGRELPLVLAAGDGGEVLDVHRAEALGTRLHGHERAVGVRDEAVLFGRGHGCARHWGGHS